MDEYLLVAGCSKDAIIDEVVVTTMGLVSVVIVRYIVDNRRAVPR
jgi:hypothetical protein